MPTRPGTQTTPARGVQTRGRAQSQTTPATTPPQPQPTPTPSPFTAPTFSYDTGAGRVGAQHGGARPEDRTGGWHMSLEALNQMLGPRGITASWSPDGLQLTGPNGQTYNNVGGSHEGAGPGGQSAFLAQALGIPMGPGYYGQVAAMDAAIAGVAQRGHYARSLGMQPDATTQDIYQRNQAARAQGIPQATLDGAAAYNPAAAAWLNAHPSNTAPPQPSNPLPPPPTAQPPTAQPPTATPDPFAVPPAAASTPTVQPPLPVASPPTPAPSGHPPFGPPSPAVTPNPRPAGQTPGPAVTPSPFSTPEQRGGSIAPTQRFGLDAQRQAGVARPAGAVRVASPFSAVR